MSLLRSLSFPPMRPMTGSFAPPYLLADGMMNAIISPADMTAMICLPYFLRNLYMCGESFGVRANVRRPLSCSFWHLLLSGGEAVEGLLGGGRGLALELLR